MTILTIIVARSANGVIGKDNKLPWNIPEDLKHFKKYTMGKPVIMGRKTFESIGRALPGRMNIVISRNPHYRAEGAIVASSLRTALKFVESDPEAVLIGGGCLYERALHEDLVDQCIITEVLADYEGDTFFPTLDHDEWQTFIFPDCPQSTDFIIGKYVRRK